jgi:hypothetical protein
LTHVTLRNRKYATDPSKQQLENKKKGAKSVTKKTLNVVPMYHKMYWTEDPYLVTSMALAQLGQIHDEQLSGLRINK